MVLKYADRMDNVKPSIIREFARTTTQPDIISFAGGLPSSDLFPTQEIIKISADILEESSGTALQYSPTEGFLPLREKIAKNMEKIGVKATADKILIISGSQQGLDFSGKTFLNPRDVVICESPTYLGATNAFAAYQGEFVQVSLDKEGMDLDELQRVIETTPQAKMIYVIPDFHNPTGMTWSLERRKEFIKIANKFNMPVIEDHPYGALRFEGDTLPAIKSLDTEGLVVFLGTFSKTLCPGLRIGWICADTQVLEKYQLIKQSADLQSNTLEQRIIDRYLEVYDYEAHIAEIIQLYKKRRDLMISIIKNKFPKEVKFVYPEGGLFVWVELPQFINTMELMKKALHKKVAFVPGSPFFPNGGHDNFMRLNYSGMPEDRIAEGMNILADVLKEAIK